MLKPVNSVFKKRVSNLLVSLILMISNVGFALAPFISADTVSASNNGTLKVHEFGTASGTESNDPKVCVFNFEGFGFDAGQEGYIVVETQPGEVSSLIPSPLPFGPASASGYYETPYINNNGSTYNLADGQYKATLYGKDTENPSRPNINDEKSKSKVFKVDCEPDSGSVKVNKKVDADGNNVYEGGNVTANNLGFDWALDNETPARNMGTIATDVPEGPHKITESGPSGFVFKGWYTTGGRNSCANPEGTSLPVTVTVRDNETTEITLCNQKNNHPGSIKIVKDASPNSNNNFNFSTNINWANGSDEFELEDDGNPNNGGTPESKIFAGLAPGQSYTFEEEPESGWYLHDIVCEGGSDVTKSLSSNKVTIELGSAENVTCTFVNRKFASLKIKKEVRPGTDNQDFSFTTEGHGLSDFTLDDDGSDSISGNGKPSFKRFVHLKDGQYTITEDKLNGWVLDDLLCTGTQDYGRDGNKLTVNLAAGDDVECTFINKKEPGTITVIKNVDLNADGDTDDDHESDVPDWLWDINGAGDFLSGSQNAQTVQPGSYWVSEQQKEDFDVSAASCSGEQSQLASTTKYVTVSPGENVVCTFTNTRETGWLKVVKILFPDDDEGRFDLLIDDEVKAYAVGNFGSTGLVKTLSGGNYKVSEEGAHGTALHDYDTFYGCLGIGHNYLRVGYGPVIEDVLVKDDKMTACAFVNLRKPTIKVVKSADPWDDEQTFEFSFEKVSWVDSLPSNTDTELDLDETITSFNSLFTINEQFTLDDNSDPQNENTKQFTVKPGKYKITEEKVEGWDLDEIDCGEAKVEAYDDYVTLDVWYGENVVCTFYNQKRADVVVTKFNDYNRDGLKDQNEPTLSDWEINLEQNYGEEWSAAKETDLNGQAVFDVKGNKNYLISETLQPGWGWSGTYCDYTEREGGNGEQDQYNKYEVYVPAGETKDCYVGNYREPVLLLEKSNDQPEPTVVGDTVTYTLTVKLPETSGALFDTCLTDLTPENFSYNGVWTAASSNPDHDVESDIVIASEDCGRAGGPDYASPGDWYLGMMTPGEIITLTYQTVIRDIVSPGKYPDIAFAVGQDIPGGNNVYSNLSVADSPFVGTDVSVVEEGEVLGEVLANTGNRWLALQFVVPMLVILGVLSLESRQKKGASV